jgi:integrase
MLAEWDIERAFAEGADAPRAKTLEWMWNRLVVFYRDTDAREISDLVPYVASRRKAGVRGQTIRREVQALRRGLAIAKRKGIVSAVPEAPRIKSDPPSQEQRGKMHPPEILAQFVAELPADARDEAELALLTGLRATELKRVRPEMVEPAPNGSATDYVLRMPAESTKTRTERVIGLSPRAIEIIRRRIEAAPDRLYVLSQQTHRRAYRETATRIGYSQRIKLRDLRHTFATLAVAAGDPWAAMEALGHKDLRMTSRYQHTTSARASQVAVSVEGGYVQWLRSADEKPKNVGGRGGFRTHDPRLVRPLWDLTAAVSTDKHTRAQLLREWLDAARRAGWVTPIGYVDDAEDVAG